MVHLTQQTVRKLAPAPDRTSVLVSTQDQIRCKKKINFTPYPTPQPASVARRNARERNRVKQVNNGFATLREHIPASVAASVTGTGRAAASKKLSKVDTLRMAVEYIRNLQQLLDDNDSDASSTITTPDQNSYYPDSPEMNHMVHHTPPCSEASVSPTPSFTSESTPYPPQKTPYQNESFENYEPMSPEDEELLDVIWWWQQQ
ncbi:achaete-scute homolog 1a-like [Arctopsyche grandis]|uniref:achaete-scute homolog 1a-like n=1 Tax=Arctopsyche grandis TaxID=121162 RepID=UPI00406D973B